jgi:membrane protein DedA with SNARE-associated domain
MQSFLVHAGYGALILFAFIEAACIPIPSELTFGFAGVLAYQGHLNLALVIILGTLAELAGSYVSYGVGRIGGRPLVERLGRYLLITNSDLGRAERFLAGRGWWAVPVGRALPFVRTFMSLVAGFAEFPSVRFGLLSLLGTAIYSSAVASVGYAVASAWTSIYHGISIASYVIVAIVVIAIAAFFVHRIREVRKEGKENPMRDPVA